MIKNTPKIAFNLQKRAYFRSNSSAKSLFRSINAKPLSTVVGNSTPFGGLTQQYQRSYHTYPDPSEKAKLTTTRSSNPKKEKVGKEYTVNAMLHLDSPLGLMTPKPPADKEAPVVPEFELKSTTLPNGITIVTQETAGLMSSFSFAVGTGSAFENQPMGRLTDPTSEVGVTHMLELTAFQSTATRSHQEVSESMEQLGGSMQCLTAKETTMYCVDVLRENLEPALEILADCVLNATISEDEIQAGRDLMRILRTELPSDLLVKDAVQRAAYTDEFHQSYQMVGNHHFAPTDEIIDTITSEKVRKFKASEFYGENCVISCVGVQHEYFVELCKKFFGCSQDSASSSGSGWKIVSNPSKWAQRKTHRPNNGMEERPHQQQQQPVYTNIADLRAYLEQLEAIKGMGFKGQPHFIGGLVKEERELKEPFVKTSVAFEIGGWHDEMFVASAVMQQILGGGSSFSAGGPGKGMYTRLYRSVLNKYHWVESMMSFISIQERCGLFGIDGGSTPEHIPQMLQVMIDALFQFAVVPVTQEELERGKNMLKSMLLMQLESRLVLCEDFSRQFVTYGKHANPTDLCKLIDAVTAEDIMSVGRRIMRGQLIGLVDGKEIRQNSHMVGPAVAVVGADVSHCPPYENIVQFASSYAQRLMEQQAQQGRK